jgi:hypothetical protein
VMIVSGETQWILIIHFEMSQIKKCDFQYTIVAFSIDDGYNDCSRLLDTVGGKNL